MAAITTDYTNLALASTQTSSTSASDSGGQDFGQVLSTQLQDGSSIATPGAAASTSDAQLALTSYNPGQVTASAASAASAATDSNASEETTAAASDDTTEATDSTAEASADTSTGWPEGVGQEWTPGNMQFYDELTGQWVDDNIPHRLNAEGMLEYCWEGQWYLDTAVRHRVSTGDESAQTAEGGDSQDPASQAAASAATTLDSDGPFTNEEYYNTALGQWALFNLPNRTNDDGTRQYYWADQWWADAMEHRAA